MYTKEMELDKGQHFDYAKILWLSLYIYVLCVYFINFEKFIYWIEVGDRNGERKRDTYSTAWPLLKLTQYFFAHCDTSALPSVPLPGPNWIYM